MTKVTREGAGAKLIENPDKIYRLLKAITENTALPVTLKTRLGPHPAKTNIFEIADAAERAGAKGLIVHARYTSQMHGGAVHLDTLAELVGKTKLTVIGNGSVTDAKTAAAMAETGVQGLMIGRAALSNPSIFSDLRGQTPNFGGQTPISGGQTLQNWGQTPENWGQALIEKEDKLANCRRHLEYLLQFRKQLAERYPNDHIPGEDGYASVKMHTHLFRYFNGRPGAAALRARLNSVRTLAEINDIISSV